MQIQLRYRLSSKISFSKYERLIVCFLSLLQRVKSGREGSARGRREGRDGSAGSAGK